MTHIGAIAGFYYDQEKKKYFKIQANHLLPQGAKYSRGSVKRDARVAKKRKIEDRKKAERQRETVKRSRVLLDSAIAGIGLARESGRVPTHRLLDNIHTALVSQWRPQRVDVLNRLYIDNTQQQHLLCARFLPATNEMLLATTAPLGTSSLLLACPWDWDIKQEPDEFYDIPFLDHHSHVTAFNSAVTSIATISEHGVPRVVACADRSIYMGFVGASSSPHVQPGHDWSININQRTKPVTALSVNQTTGRTALACEEYVGVLGPRGEHADVMYVPPEHECAPCVDWRDVNTVAYGDNTNRKLMLWDARIRDASGTSARFTLRDRITGIYSDSEPNGHPNLIVVSTNQQINVFDTRMTAKSHAKSAKRNVDIAHQCFPHVHQGPRLQFATNNLRLIAAVDRDNVVQVYSMRNWDRVGALTMPPTDLRAGRLGDMVTDLQWYEDRRGCPVLQACQASAVVRWNWGGAGGDEG